MTRLASNWVSTACAVFVLSLAGCASQPYPAGLVYPLRTDLIVVEAPAQPPDGPPAPGKLDLFVAELADRGGKTLDPTRLDPDVQSSLKQVLEVCFGNPAEPKLQGDASVQRLTHVLDISPARLVTGGTLYKRHCLHCHGLTGDGRGVTGQWVYPAPRDFRQGLFKYVSSKGSAARKPSRADLQHLLEIGIDRTSMPSFALLSQEERDDILAYMIHLSVRGEVEYRLLKDLLSPNAEAIDDLSAEANALLKSCLERWVEADQEAIVPATALTPETLEGRMTPEHLESVRRGAALFSSQSLNCMGCHIDYGRRARYLYDVWGGVSRAADLTESAYRGGKRPIDLFYRIRGGIGPVGMPAATSLDDTQVWDLVHFVLALPISGQLPEDVRVRVYPPGQ